ncbi:hypothetical protein EJ06DRAFT_495242 [Trichodelitschia bisporula]|uniref:Zn(2)-C6 fungal-type domain-containing protein n=1 Tax=Trichodelitschia bisporula TaxID=703511 RepID=A0A6G1HUH7_9PEZI|nr:hypothetical protein EJ06DRAFT_495242 [Trichodelitschia bisporula]
MTAKRAHKKSRNGCAVCRQRRVKCDEIYPACGPCMKHAVRCNYDRTTKTAAQRNPPPRKAVYTLKPPPPAFGQPTTRMIDLQLMNHYVYLHLGSDAPYERFRRMWAFDVVQLSLGCEFLMQSLLSTAALDLHIRRPEDKRMGLVAHQYFDEALRLATRELPGIGPHNAEPIFAATTQIQRQVFQSWKDPCCATDVYRPPVTWLAARRGVSMILEEAALYLRESCMKPLLEVAANLTLGDESPVFSPDALAAVAYTEEFAAFGAYLEQDEGKGAFIVKHTFDQLQQLMIAHRGQPKEPRNQIRRWLLTFPTALEKAFIEMLKEEDPRAMITFSYYFAIMQTAPDLWWFKERSQYEIRGVYSILPEPWKRYLEWPMAVSQG